MLASDFCLAANWGATIAFYAGVLARLLGL
ncbi:hypothetical protein FHT76_007623 [Rhizobium sp. BK176]|nr:hypothetical protein [Rhizobium sp. BK661]MCS4095902.1 hypothetical protein [Rhizobium sp. BK176]